MILPHGIELFHLFNLSEPSPRERRRNGIRIKAYELFRREIG